MEKKRLNFTFDDQSLQPRKQFEALCCECGQRVLNEPEYLRLKLCVMCMCFGLIAYCVTCGENYPEHHPGGRGCATFIDPLPGESDVADQDEE